MSRLHLPVKLVSSKIGILSDRNMVSLEVVAIPLCAVLRLPLIVRLHYGVLCRGRSVSGTEPKPCGNDV